MYTTSRLFTFRYIVVVHPFKLQGSLTRSKCRVALVLIWLLAALLSIPVILITVSQKENVRKYQPAKVLVPVPMSTEVLLLPTWKEMSRKSKILLLQDVYSIVYTDPAHSQEVEVYKCTEDSAVDQPWTGKAVSLYQLATLLVIPAVLATCCYQAVIRVLWRSTRYHLSFP